MDDKRRQAFIGKVDAQSQERGWFFGHFMDEPLLRSDLVEVTWQRLPERVPADDQRHLHRQTVEINVVIAGTIELRINDVAHTFRRGDFFVIWPEAVVSDVRSDADAEMIVIRAPSVPGDKFPAPK
ncbi:MAG TPA: cupin domain-containing protein [Gaiellaceae bacterium]|nr:cupin domain-containing protein [Gaiellaceae bacterium]